MLAQFFLAREVTGKDSALTKLNRQIDELTSLLALERAGKQTAQTNLAALTTTLDVATRRSTPAGPDGRVEGERGWRRRRGGAGGRAISTRKSSCPPAPPRRSTCSTSRSPRCAASLPPSRTRYPPPRRGTRRARRRSPTSARASTSRWRRRCRNLPATAPTSSAACARSSATARRPIVVGDRFVFQSEVLFEPGQAAVNAAGHAELDQLATALVQLEREIPPDLPWVMRVDGHTDDRRSTRRSSRRTGSCRRRAPSPLLSTWRAGVSTRTGWSRPASASSRLLENAAGDDPRNRRIELKLTER